MHALLAECRTQITYQERNKAGANERQLLTYVHELLAAFPRAACYQAPQLAVDNLAAAIGEPLSERELEVLRLIAEGASNQGIAARLVISMRRLP